MIYLQRLGDATSTEQQAGKHSVVLGTVDIKDEFPMVDQEKPMAVSLHNKLYRVKKNVQRLGAKMWYWIFRDFLNKHLDMHRCIEQPCKAKNSHCCVMVHVDDVMFCGDGWYWENVFLKKLKEHYNISHSQLQSIGSEIAFLKRRIKRLEEGLALIPGTKASKVIELFEENFGKARPQTIACDASIQTEDVSEEVGQRDAHAFRAVIGTLLFLARVRPDLLFVVKDAMSRPTLTAISRLRKVIGYLKTTSDFCMVLEKPIGGQGKWKNSERFWVIETFSDSDWNGNKQHRRSTSCGVHALNGGFLFASSRTQRVVSLSSCESELHSMVSALCDGIYLRRCIEFLTVCQVEHHLLVYLPSARQVATRQGPGRLKHVSGKLLWIQQVVHEGKVQMTQVPTLWNVADAGTKPLASKCIQMLLHCIGMARAEGDQTIGQEEYEVQFQKYSSGKQINALAKNIARVIVFMGLEPLQGATAMPLGESDIYGANAQCSIEPNHVQSDGYSWMFIMQCAAF